MATPNQEGDRLRAKSFRIFVTWEDKIMSTANKNLIQTKFNLFINGKYILIHKFMFLIVPCNKSMPYINRDGAELISKTFAPGISCQLLYRKMRKCSSMSPLNR